MLTARSLHRDVLAVFACIFLLGLAYGLSIALVSLHLDAQRFSKGDIGTLAVWFASGIVTLSLPMGTLVRRFSARGTLVVALVVYAASVALFPSLTTYRSIAAARFVDGAASVGIWVSSETILLSRTDRANKAFATSLYAICMAVGYVLGPVVARVIVATAPMRSAFLASGLIALVAAGVAATHLQRDAMAMHEGGPRGETRARELLLRIRTSCFATFAYGYFQASVVLFLPLFLIEDKGVAREQTILVPAFFAGGMLLFSNVAGRLGDARGHLAVMRVLAAVGAATVASFIFLDRFPAMCAAVFVAGATLASISPVSLALQGVAVPPGDFARANAIYNAFYAAGMLLGPPISSILFVRFGGAGMLWHLAGLWAAFVVFTIACWRDDPAARGVRFGGEPSVP